MTTGIKFTLTANQVEAKHRYLLLIDLLREYRLKELGKLGPTHIPKDNVDAITKGFKPEHMFSALIADGVIAKFDEGSNTPPLLIIQSEGVKEMVFDCIITAEKIAEYRASLAFEGPLAVELDARKGHYYMYRTGV